MLRHILEVSAGQDVVKRSKDILTVISGLLKLFEQL